MYRIWVPVLLILSLAACKEQAEEPPAAAQATQEAADAVEYNLPDTAELDYHAMAVHHADRPEVDKERDLQRKPEEVMAFAGLQPGMAVLDLFAGGGWYTELQSRVVGEKGQVWMHNPPQYYERVGEDAVLERLANNRLPNVVRHDRPVDALELPEARFDFVVAGMVFHDLYWMAEDVGAVLRQLHAALKPGGGVLITDHAAPEGTGAEYALQREGGPHRIEEAFVIAEMEAAGFRLAASSDVLRVPEDDRSKPFYQMEGAFTDRFVLLFRKPEEQGPEG